MAALFSKPKTPTVVTPEPPPPAPERSNDETATLAAEQRAKFNKRGGRGFTMLTGGQGAGSGMSAMRFLGGAART